MARTKEDRMLRKAIVVLALIAASALFLGAVPTPASAANCNFYMGPTVWQPEGNYLRFGESFNNCSRVDMIQFARYYNGGQWAGWTDYSNGTWQIAPSGLNPELVGFGRPGIVVTAAGWTWYKTPWCAGATHVIATSSLYQIHNMDTNTWGGWHLMQSSHYAIVC